MNTQEEMQTVYKLTMHSKSVLVTVNVILSILQDVSAMAMVSLTQETPCLPAQSCRLRCSVVSASNDNGLSFTRNSMAVVTCPGGRDSCSSRFLAQYSHTQVDYNTSYLDIRSFNVSFDATNWSCVDGFSGTPSIRQVIQNALPTGSLTWGSTCVSGRVTSPASLSCSGLSPGTPNASLAILNSSNQTVASSQTGSVTWTMPRGGQASCSVTWSAFPSFPLNITTTQCNVQVVASVTISVRNTTGQDKVVTCQAEGHPDTYTFQPWLQSWGGQEVRTVTGSQQGGQYNLTLTSYQDTGTYTCTVDNGVLDTSGQVIRRSANVTVTVEAAPVLPLPSDPPIVSGEDGEPVRLYRSLYASPDWVNYNWSFIAMIPGATTNGSRDLVRLPVHGTTVTTEGAVINLYLTVSQQYRGLYRLQACNRIGCSSANVTLVVASVPSPPESLSAKPGSDRVELSWTPGLAGGNFFQWFHVQHRRQDSQEGQWSDVSTADNRSSSDRTPVTVTVQGLQPDTSYVFRVRAQSSRPQRNLSNYTEVTATTIEVAAIAGSDTAALVGGVVGGCVGLVVIVVVIVVIVCVRRRKGSRGRDKRPLKKSTQEEVALGSANPTYGSSPDEQKPHSAHPIFDDEESNDYSYDSTNLSPSTSALQGKSVSSPPAAPTKDVYAVSSKKAAKNDVYAVPDKKGGKAGGKGNAKSSTHEKTGGKMNPAQDPEKPGPVRELRGGLSYSTVEVVQKPGQAPRPVLSKKSKPDAQYKNEPVDYAIIDHTKRA